MEDICRAKQASAMGRDRPTPNSHQNLQRCHLVIIRHDYVCFLSRYPAGPGRPVLPITSVVLQWNWGPCRGGESAKPHVSRVSPLRDQTITLWIIIVVLAMILPIEALRNALVKAFNQITSNLNSIP